MRAKKSAAEPDRPEIFFRLIEPHLSAFQGYLHHRTDYLRSLGDLARGDPSDEEARGATASLRRVVRNPKPGYMRRWLKRLVAKYLKREIARRTREQMPHLEDDVPETPPQEGVATGEIEDVEHVLPRDIQNFWPATARRR